jgi:hypothetical protein
MIQEAAPRISGCTYTCNVAKFIKQSDFSCRYKCIAGFMEVKLHQVGSSCFYMSPSFCKISQKKNYFLSSVIATDKTLSLQNSKKKRHSKVQKINLRQQYYAAFSLLYLLNTKRQDYGIDIIIQEHSADSFLEDIKRKIIKTRQSVPSLE